MWPDTSAERLAALQRAVRATKTFATEDIVEAWMAALEHEPEAVAELFAAFGATGALIEAATAALAAADETKSPT